MSGTSGRTSRTPFAFFDPATRSLRTSQTTFDLGLPTSSPTLPASGSMRSGALYARRRSALPTPVSGCSSSPLLKTPTAQLAVNGGSQHPDKRKAGGHGPTLADEVEHLLPTPTVADSRGTRNTTAGRKTDNPNVHLGWTLTDVAYSGQLLPTPRASDTGTPGRRASEGWRPPLSQVVLSPRTGAAAGAASVPPSPGGKPSPDDVPPGQLTIEDA